MPAESASREYVDARLAALELRITEQRQAHERAIDVASQVLNARLVGMNEFRATIGDLISRTATKDYVDILRDALVAKQDRLLDRIADVRVQAAAISAIVTVLLSLIVASAARWIR